MNDQQINYILHLADNALILGHRNSEWCGHGPVLEQDIAITNISLDLIGQARNFYQYAAQLINRAQKTESALVSPLGGDLEGVTEDSLAYLRNAEDFKNCLMVELPKGDWAFTILRQFYFSQYQFLLFTELIKSKDEQLSAIAEKSIKEVTYHLRWSSEWVIRLGDGTAESKTRLQKAVQELSGYTAELFMSSDYEKSVAKEKTSIDPKTLEDSWNQKVKTIFREAGLQQPGLIKNLSGGKIGKHGDDLNDILKDLQYLQRTYPGAEW